MNIDDLITIIENNDCDLSRIKNMVGLLWDLHAINASALKDYEIREKFNISQTLIETLFELIIYKEKEYSENIDKIYENKKSLK